MSKALIYAVTSTQQLVEDNGTVSFDTIVRKSGNALNLWGGNVMTSEAGYYRVNVNVTVLSTAAEDVEAIVMLNGVAVPGASASFTSTAANQYGTLTIPCIIRTYGCAMSAPSVITVQVNNAATVTNAAIEVVH